MTVQVIQLRLQGMAGRKPSAPSQYQNDIILRTKSARVVSGLSRELVCERLTAKTGHKVLLGTYKKWETRTPIPHFFIIPFCEIVSADPYMLLTGTPFQLGRQPPANPVPLHSGQSKLTRAS